MKATVLYLFLCLSFLLPGPVLGGKEWDSAIRNFDGPLSSHFEVDIFGVNVLGGRDAVVEVTSLRNGIAELNVTKGGTRWATRCILDVVEGKEHLQEGESYTVKTTASDIDCKTIDAKAAPYVDMSALFTPTTEKYTIDGLETKCCCVGGMKNNVCRVVPTQGYLSKFIRIAKRHLFNIWNPLSSAHFFALQKMLFKNKDGCGMLVGKGYHSHTKGVGGSKSKSWLDYLTGRGQLLPNPKCRAKRSIFTLPFSQGSADAKDNGEESAEEIAREYLDQILKAQPARWYSKEIPYADRASIKKTAEEWLKSLKLDKDDQQRVDSASEVAFDQQVLDSSEVKLTEDENPETLPEERFPLKLMARFLTHGGAERLEEGEL